MLSKRELREELKARRAAIANPRERSRELWQRVCELDEWRFARTVMLYLSFGSEPQWDGLMSDALMDGRRVLVPRVEGDDMVAVDIESEEPTYTSSFGVSEIGGPAVPIESIDFVLVPGLAFTRAGDRIGFGRGYYDRFLAELDGRCPTVGACLREMLVDELPTDPWDRRVDIVVTD